tara:strand:+ start:1943 stop:2851 length:909 start_codon:yes stop_codon:yes gene_type:complete
MATNYLLTESQENYYDGTDVDYGSYQFIDLSDIINNFIVAYVGEDKIISKIKRVDVAFHAQRALQELSYDTLKSIKSQEIEIPPSLLMTLPQDYVNYVKLTYSDSGGIEHILYPASKTSNPYAISQAADGSYDNDGTNLTEQDATNHLSDTWTNFKSSNSASSSGDDPADDQDTNIYDFNVGQRYGIDPQFAQGNGSFFMDELQGRIHFSSAMNGKTITLKYISDSLGTEEEMKVHKFAEEAMYKWIAHAVLATRANTQEYLVARFKKERFAAVRTAKLRLSNLKIEELTQIMRGKSKQIKH